MLSIYLYNEMKMDMVMSYLLRMLLNIVTLERPPIDKVAVGKMYHRLRIHHKRLLFLKSQSLDHSQRAERKEDKIKLDMMWG